MVLQWLWGLSGKAMAAFMALVMTFILPASQSGYAERIDESGMFKNTVETALPQTIVAEMVRNHFHSPLAPGKTAKKCIVIGMDGARCDSALNSKGINESGINILAAQGGLYVATAGSDGTLLHTQPTKTAPGWTTLLTGKWAINHMVWYNGIIKLVNPKTFLTTLVEDGSAKSSSFKCIWPWHAKNLYSTYRLEETYTQIRNLPVSWETYTGQEELQASILNEVKDPAGADIIFSIYERPDEAGHAYGYGSQIPEYAEAVKLCDKDAYDIIQAIKARPNYLAEDWLIIMTSDHGGQDKDHGNLSEDCRFIFIATNKTETVNE